MGAKGVGSTDGVGVISEMGDDLRDEAEELVGVGMPHSGEDVHRCALHCSLPLLNNCQVRFCIAQSELDTFYVTSSGESSSISLSLLAGLVILGIAIMAIILLFLLGTLRR